ncbi:MAG: S41 family peptidase [Gammaproteobacteria bacterium]|nr:S41 family peptidase [Gammaproteobacteria bacterium]MCZ6879608.1 S41 family peptidase [Gammaproteobacteria bacterium]
MSDLLMSMSRKYQCLSVLLASLFLSVALTLTSGVLADRYDVESETEGMPVDQTRLFAEVLHKVRSDYIDEVSYEELIEMALRGMVAGLDSHSVYLDAEEYEEILISTAGSYSGVGLEVSVENNQVLVVAPFDGTPAKRAGIRSGDIIISIDGMPVLHDNLGETISRMRGKPGTRVKFVVSRAGAAEPLSFDLERTRIQIASVKGSMLEPGYGYLRIAQFSDNTGAELEDALRTLMKKAGGQLHGLVLDLRDNPGGVLDSAVEVADLFLNSGVVVSASGRADDASFSMRARQGDLLEGARLAVLVNSGSASSSEIVAGALKDLDRATIVGSQTYGKGSVQTVIPLSGGRALKLTTSRYFTPSGESIHQRGIMPDIVVTSDDEESVALTSLTSAVEADALMKDNQVRTALATIKRRPILHSRAK